jgi:hypothetical protein
MAYEILEVEVKTQLSPTAFSPGDKMITVWTLVQFDFLDEPINIPHIYPRVERYFEVDLTGEESIEMIKVGILKREEEEKNRRN